jgi:glycosyltransferase involved in cell wall biosynthesis
VASSGQHTVAPGLNRTLLAAPEPFYIICGDLLSCNGYAKSARAIADLLREQGTVLGLSLHEDPSDNAQVFPGTLITHAQLFKLALARKAIVIHHTTPDNFFLVPKAMNVGMFYWETRSQPRDLDWPRRMAMMDAIWAPTRFVEQFVRESGYKGPVHLVPWPHDLDIEVSADIGQIKATVVSTVPRSDENILADVRDVASLRKDFSFLCLSIQSLAPRKGLQVLLDEWRRFLAAAPDRKALLLLKLSFRHALDIDPDPARHFALILQRYGFKPGDRLQIALIQDRLSDEEMLGLTKAADLYLSSSFGEGFGGPIVEAISVGTPVIVPRHTGIADIVPADYPLIPGHREYLIGLRDNLPVYPHSSFWNVVDSDEIARNIGKYWAMSIPERAMLSVQLRDHAERFCGRDAVSEVLRSACRMTDPEVGAEA